MRYRVRIETFREEMAKPRRLVPHSVRSLAKVAKVNKTIIGYLLTGERPYVNEDVAVSIAEVFEKPVAELFTPEVYTSMSENADDRRASDG